MNEDDCTSKDFAIMKFRFTAKLAVFLIALCFGYFFVVTCIPIPEDKMGNANTIIGFIILNVGIVIGYFFGSSQSTSAHTKRDQEQPIVTKED